MIIRDLEESLICSLTVPLESVEIGTIVPNVGRIGFCAKNEDGCHRHHLAGLPMLILLIQMAIGFLHTFGQQMENSLRFERIRAMEGRKHVFTELVCGETTEANL